MNWYSTIWYWYCWVSFIPMAGCLVYRLRNQDYYYNYQIAPKSYKIDYWFQLMLVPMIAYYILDAAYLVAQHQNMDSCNFGFLFHHLVTLVGSKTILTIPHFPWFLIAPFTLHNLLVMLPYQTWLNYLYLVSLLMHLYGMLQEPWIKMASYRLILYVGLGITAGPVVVLWWFECKNDMENVM